MPTLTAGPALATTTLFATPAPAADSGPLLPMGDDLELKDLVTAAETSLRIMTGRDDSLTFELCGQVYSLGQLRQGLRDFTEAALQTADSAGLITHVRENFRLCRSAGEQRPGMAFLTGYYAPELVGSLKRDEKYRYPLYMPPPNLARINGREGRIVGGELLPYWSRAEIENGDLLAGHELVYLADPLEAFLLHVQGSGRIRFPDGSLRPVLFAGKSGRQYRSIGRLLIAEGKLTLQEADLPGILNYLRANPEEQRRILHHNEAYIFFRWGDAATPGPLGSFGLPLTAGRSLAMDQQIYPPGVLAYLTGVKPLADHEGAISGWQPFGRFVFNHDSGSAIRGAGRIDLFLGDDRYAELAAGVTRHPAELFLLLPLIETENKSLSGQEPIR